MTTTGTGAFEALLAHHEELADGVARRVRALASGVKEKGGFEAASGELVAYLAAEVLPHASAEEATVYAVAARRPELAETVQALTAEHARLVSLVERLATAGGPEDAVAEAEAIGALFSAHVAMEDERVLAPLEADEATDLERVLQEMHRLTKDAGTPKPRADEEAPETEAALVRLLLEGAGQLAAAGEGEGACRLAARAWAALRAPRPDLAVRVTAALHRLVRSVTAEPVRFSPGRTAGTTADAQLDVRALAPAERHEQIFATYAALGAGTGFVLVNDHDPKPLRYQFEAEHTGDFTWDVLEAGPKVWRVRIGRPVPGATVDGPRGGAAMDGEPELDVRRLPHGRRHDVIFTTFEALEPGGGFVLTNDHDPRPLRYQFEAQHAGDHTWDYLEAGPEVWRVRITRVAGGRG